MINKSAWVKITQIEIQEFEITWGRITNYLNETGLFQKALHQTSHILYLLSIWVKCTVQVPGLTMDRTSGVKYNE